MMGASMIERVAEAMCDAAHDGDDGAARDWNSNRGAYRDMARAAIKTMREPSRAIIEAAEDIVVGFDDFAMGDGNIYLGIPGYPQKATEVWEKMIDAALAEERT